MAVSGSLQPCVRGRAYRGDSYYGHVRTAQWIGEVLVSWLGDRLKLKIAGDRLTHGYSGHFAHLAGVQRGVVSKGAL